MSTMALTNCRLWMGAYELSGHLNSIGLDYAVELLDDTVFGTAGTRSNKPGLKTLTINGGGFWDDNLDGAIYDRIGAKRELISVSPTGFAEGDRAFFTRAVNGSYNPISGEVGQLLAFELDFHNADCLMVRGAVLAQGEKIATGVAMAGANLGPVAAVTQRCYGGLHVKMPIGGTAPTLDVVIESAPDSAFGAPTAQLTFPQVTNVPGGFWQEKPGPIADTWWRARWTVSGGTPQYTIFVVFGIN